MDSVLKEYADKEKYILRMPSESSKDFFKFCSGILFRLPFMERIAGALSDLLNNAFNTQSSPFDLLSMIFSQSSTPSIDRTSSHSIPKTAQTSQIACNNYAAPRQQTVERAPSAPPQMPGDRETGDRVTKESSGYEGMTDFSPVSAATTDNAGFGMPGTAPITPASDPTPQKDFWGSMASSPIPNSTANAVEEKIPASFPVISPSGSSPSDSSPQNDIWNNVNSSSQDLWNGITPSTDTDLWKNISKF